MVLRRSALCALLTGFALYGLALAPQADAQYPGGGGGGGYPGGGTYPGGGYPGGPAPGWLPLPNPTASTPQNPIYDWIGFDNQITLTPFTGSPQTPTSHTYNGGEEGNVGGNYMMEYPFNGTGGSGNTLASADAQTSGTAKYKWQWVPPNNAAGQPDWATFPAPTLFTLADVSALAWTRLPSGTNTAGLSASGLLSDGLPDNWSVPLTGVPQQVGDTVPHRAVLPTVPEPNAAWSASVSPSGKLKVSGKQTVLQNGYMGPGGTCISAFQVSVQAFPITLSAPNPFGRPDLGDGKNQFVYDATTPKANLYVHGVVSVPGASADDTDWLLHDLSYSPHVDLKLDLPAETLVQACFPVPSAGQIRWQHGAPPYTDDFWYAGLPTKNSDFGGGHMPGYHLATMQVNAKISQQAGFQIFFTGINSTSNYPNASQDHTTNGFYTPNWYYYYNQASPSGGSYDAANTLQQFLAYTDFYGPNYAIHIETGTYDEGATIQQPVFDIDPTVDPTTGENLVRCVGTIAISGLQKYLTICAHEKGHQNVFNMTDSTTGLPIYSPGTKGQPWLPSSNSNDGDHVLDSWERQHHLDPTKKDTTRFYTTYDGDSEPGDDEVLADVQALLPLLNSREMWQQDW